MQDRQPGAPGQYKAVIDAAELLKMQAGEQFVITMTRDDQPLVEGTPYNKASVLPDDLAALICPDVLDPTPADALRALQKRGTFSIVRLWENASPESTFANGQEIAVDLAEDDLVIIICREATTAGSTFSTVGRAGEATRSIGTFNGSIVRRFVNIQENVITIGKGQIVSTYGTVTDDNTKAIPVAIYVIKGGAA